MQAHPTPKEFSLLLDGRLSPEAQAEWQARLESDPVLAKSFQQFKDSRDVMRASEDLRELPNGFDARLRARLQTDELRSRADLRARAATSRESWWQRSAVAISGMAAGVLVMLSVDASGIFRDQTSVILPAPEAGQPADALPTLSSSTVEQLVAQKAGKFDQLRRNVYAYGKRIPSAWMQSELELTIEDVNPELLELASKSALNRDRMVVLEEILRAKLRLSDILKQGQPDLDREAVIAVIGRAASPASEVRATMTRVLPMEQAREYVKNANQSEAYAAARRQFDDSNYAMSAALFSAFISAHPDSPGFDSSVWYAARSLQRCGDASSALSLLDEVSKVRPGVLARFRREEIQEILTSVEGPRTQIVTVDLGGNFHCFTQRTTPDASATTDARRRFELVMSRYLNYAQPDPRVEAWERGERIKDRYNTNASPTPDAPSAPGK